MSRRRQFSTTRNETIEEQLHRSAINNKLEEFTSIQTTPPAYVNKIAKAEYRRLRPLLEELPISNLDLNLVVVYCHLYSVYRELQKEMDEEGLIIESFYATGELKERKINGALNELLKTSKEMRAIAGELGLSINSRMKLIDKELQKIEDDPFSDMFKEGN